MNNQSIYSTLHQARKTKGLTQAELGKILSAPQSYVSQVEKGKHDIKASTLTDWSRVLDLELVLVPKAMLSTVSYLLKADSPAGEQLPPPAYGPLADEVE